MIPELDASTGYLPPGIYVATWVEVAARFAVNSHRTRLTTGLKDALVNLAGAGCRSVLLDGSDENLPLRVVPLQIQVFTPVAGRLDPMREASLMVQERAIEVWTSELDNRFGPDLRTASIVDVPLCTGRGHA